MGHCTITIRVIRSFEYRTCRNIVLHDLDLEELTGSELVKKVLEELEKVAKPISTYGYDTLKIYTQAHASKPNNTAINLGKDEELRIHDWSLPLSRYSVQHETELSLFKDSDYQEFLKHPSLVKW